MLSNMRFSDTITLVPRTAFKSENIELSKDAALLCTAIATFTCTTPCGLRPHVPLDHVRFDAAVRELQAKGLLPQAKESGHAKG